MCQRCHVKKAQCSFNKGSDDGGPAESTTVMELLQDISSSLRIWRTRSNMLWSAWRT